MKKIFLVLLFAPLMAFSQSDDGTGTVLKIKPVELGKSNLAKGLKITNHGGEESKLKKRGTC